MKQQNEIWSINLDPTIGAEIKKTRPAIIVNDNAIGLLPLKIIVPITDWKEQFAVAKKIIFSVNNLCWLFNHPQNSNSIFNRFYVLKSHGEFIFTFF
ncbi:MAG: type II toxin-antitoxin system PemK/MazF family toxin [Bacteroidales bacterium]|nr:type II toxin-antitoxin system PemK/MazF family toxin [Bacteroidales bacterium]